MMLVTVPAVPVVSEPVSELVSVVQSPVSPVGFGGGVVGSVEDGGSFLAVAGPVVWVRAVK